jgi:hypothetical protein
VADGAGSTQRRAHGCAPWCFRLATRMVVCFSGGSMDTRHRPPHCNPAAGRALDAPSTTNGDPVFADKITLTHDHSWLSVTGRNRPSDASTARSRLFNSQTTVAARVPHRGPEASNDIHDRDLL